LVCGEEVGREVLETLVHSMVRRVFDGIFARRRRWLLRSGCIQRSLACVLRKECRGPAGATYLASWLIRPTAFSRIANWLARSFSRL
jgi:hypothetical protein